MPVWLSLVGAPVQLIVLGVVLLRVERALRRLTDLEPRVKAIEELHPELLRATRRGR